jgi:hypothetical protein
MLDVRIVAVGEQAQLISRTQFRASPSHQVQRIG